MQVAFYTINEFNALAREMGEEVLKFGWFIQISIGSIDPMR